MKNKLYSTITALLIVAAISVPASISLLGNADYIPPSNVEETPVSEGTPISIVNNSQNYIADDCNIDYVELELHNNELTVMSMDEANEMIRTAKDTYEKGTHLIDRTDYVTSIKSENDINSFENKSFIYHMMLNSIDYFDTAIGTIEYSFQQSEPIKVDFITNLEEQFAYEKEYLPNDSIDELYVYDGMGYKLNGKQEIYSKFICSDSGDFNISNNNRVVMLDEGNLLNINRKDITNLAVSGNSCLFPQQFAMTRMCDFDNWTIVGYKEYLGRECVTIEGSIKNSNFKMVVDINYGFLIDYTEFSEDGTIISYVKALDVENDVTVEKKIIE